jgi:hypothetical protein
MHEMTNPKSDLPGASNSPEWLRGMVNDVAGEYVRDVLKGVVRWLTHRPPDTFMMALNYGCERDAEIAKITLATGSEHWAVRKDGTIICVFPDLDPPVAEHPDLKNLSEDIFVPARGVNEQLSWRWWPGRRAPFPRLPPGADSEPQE